MKILIAIALLAGCADETCRIEDSVDQAIARDDLVDCGSAFRDGDRPYDAAPFQAVHECMTNAIATATPFVGVYIQGGVEGANRYAFIGTRVDSHLDYQLLYQSFNSDGSDTAMTRTTCSALTTNGDIGRLGYACEDATPVVVCTPP